MTENPHRHTTLTRGHTHTHAHGNDRGTGVCVCGVSLSDSTVTVVFWRSGAAAAAAANLSRLHFPRRQPVTVMRSPSQTHKRRSHSVAEEAEAFSFTRLCLNRFPETVSQEELLNLDLLFCLFSPTLFDTAKLTSTFCFVFVVFSITAVVFVYFIRFDIWVKLVLIQKTWDTFLSLPPPTPAVTSCVLKLKPNKTKQEKAPGVSGSMNAGAKHNRTPSIKQNPEVCTHGCSCTADWNVSRRSSCLVSN